MKRSDFEIAQVSGVHLLTEGVDLGGRVDRRSLQAAVPAQPDGDVLLGDHQHPARTAAGVVDGRNHAVATDPLLVARERGVVESVP
jgi:hypothetical protein